MVTEIPKHDNVMTQLGNERLNVLGTAQSPEDNSKVVFSEDVLRPANNSSFLRIHHTDDSGNDLLSSLGRIANIYS
jgi:hypothetical protein